MTLGGCIPECNQFFAFVASAKRYSYIFWDHKRCPKPHKKLAECHCCTERFIGPESSFRRKQYSHLFLGQ